MTKMTNLETLMINHPTVSLKKLAEATGACYQYLLKASKRPIPNTVYDPANFNYPEVEKLILKKVALDEIDFEAIEATVKVVLPISKIEEFSTGTNFSLRNVTGTFQVVYLTATHVVFISTAEDATQPRVMNNDTFLHQSPRIVNVGGSI